MILATIDDENFRYEHLLSSPKNVEEIKSFFVEKESGKGLEIFLKERAVAEEYSRNNRTYLVRDKETDEIAAYFSLHTGAFTVSLPNSTKSDSEKFTIPSVELSNFAVNSSYKKNHPEMPRIGEQVFRSFILPTVNYGAQLFGIQALHIYALPEDDLIDHYSTFGFSRLPHEMEAFIHETSKPSYDDSCIFMYQIL